MQADSWSVTVDRPKSEILRSNGKRVRVNVGAVDARVRRASYHRPTRPVPVAAKSDSLPPQVAAGWLCVLAQVVGALMILAGGPVAVAGIALANIMGLAALVMALTILIRGQLDSGMFLLLAAGAGEAIAWLAFFAPMFR